MVVRQDLPAEIVSRLEKRVNSRGSLIALGAVPQEGQTVLAAPLPCLTSSSPAASRSKPLSATRPMYTAAAKRDAPSTTHVSAV